MIGRTAALLNPHPKPPPSPPLVPPRPPLVPPAHASPRHLPFASRPLCCYIAAHVGTPLSVLFIDGGHGEEPAWADYRNWTPKIVAGGILAIHDVFEDPADGGRPPYELYLEATSSGAFTELSATGSLRVLERTAN